MRHTAEALRAELEGEWPSCVGALIQAERLLPSGCRRQPEARSETSPQWGDICVRRCRSSSRLVFRQFEWTDSGGAGATRRPWPPIRRAWSMLDTITPGSDPSAAASPKHVADPAPRRLAPLEPVPLDLLCPAGGRCRSCHEWRPRRRPRNADADPRSATGGRSSDSSTRSRSRRPRRTASTPTHADHPRNGPSDKGRTVPADWATARRRTPGSRPSTYALSVRQTQPI